MKHLEEYDKKKRDLEAKSLHASLELFRQASKRIPAYKKFLKENSVNPDGIKEKNDFKKIPYVSKDNYLRKHPLNELCWDGNLFNNNLVSLSSGSSGKPFFWPRGDEQTQESQVLYQQLYEESLDVRNKSSLLVVCFSMGTWIAGVYTTLGALRTTNEFDMNIITPGIEIEDAINALMEVYSLYDQVILAGYPPFIKDLLDFGTHRGIDWADMTLKFTFAGESISEDWRDSLIKSVGNKISPLETFSLYGTADMGIVGYETPLSIFIRREIHRQGKSDNLFEADELPTLVQYDQKTRYIESIKGKLVITSNYGIPLIRYDIKDNGGKLSLENIAERLRITEFPVLNGDSVLHKSTPSDFVYILGREDLSISFYSLIVYPEHIKKALENSAIGSKTTGKFILKKSIDKAQNQILELHIELSPGIESSSKIESQFKDRLISTLLELNSEYRKLYKSIGADSASPHVSCYSYGESDLFKIKNKQKWIQ